MDRAVRLAFEEVKEEIAALTQRMLELEQKVKVYDDAHAMAMPSEHSQDELVEELALVSTKIDESEQVLVKLKQLVESDKKDMKDALVDLQKQIDAIKDEDKKRTAASKKKATTTKKKAVSATSD